MTAIEPATPGLPAQVDMSEEEALDLLGKLGVLTDVSFSIIHRLYLGRAWIALGHASWVECCEERFAGFRIGLDRPAREVAVITLRRRGMSERAITEATGIPKSTVHDIASRADVAGTDLDRVVHDPLDRWFNSDLTRNPEPSEAERLAALYPQLSLLGPDLEPASDPDDDIVDAEIIDEHVGHDGDELDDLIEWECPGCSNRHPKELWKIPAGRVQVCPVCNGHAINDRGDVIPNLTPSSVQGVDGKTYPAKDTTKPRPVQEHDHPAKFSKDVLAVAATWIEPGWAVLDPFAGVGGIDYLTDCYGDAVETVGVELEPDWARRGHMICGDARHLADIPAIQAYGQFDAVVTSPPYGNRMADTYDPDDDYHRDTYTRHLGHELADGNAGALQWGDEYRTVLRDAWSSTIGVLKTGGLFVLNIKDHIRGDKVQHVAAWHVDTIMTLADMELVGHHMIPTRGRGGKSGANAAQVVPCEEIYVFAKRSS